MRGFIAVLCFLVFFISIVTSQMIPSTSTQSKKCANIDAQLESCIAYGYKVKWIKCAARHFAIEHLGYDTDSGITSQNAHQVRPGKDMKEEEEQVAQGLSHNLKADQLIGSDPRKSAQDIRSNVVVVKKAPDSEEKSSRWKRSTSGKKRKKRTLVSPTFELDNKYEEIKDKLTEKERRGCRGVERKIKKNCAAETKYSCVTLQEALGARRRKLAEMNGVLPGGSSYAEFNDPRITEAIKRVLMEFKRRAYTSGNMAPEETIIIGEVDEVSTAVVAGQLYDMTINIGITSDPDCKANAYNGVVAYKKCEDTESLGKAQLSVVYQSWSDIQWKWFEYIDLEGTPLKEKYWDN